MENEKLNWKFNFLCLSLFLFLHLAGERATYSTENDVNDTKSRKKLTIRVENESFWLSWWKTEKRFSRCFSRERLEGWRSTCEWEKVCRRLSCNLWIELFLFKRSIESQSSKLSIEIIFSQAFEETEKFSTEHAFRINRYHYGSAVERSLGKSHLAEPSRRNRLTPLKSDSPYSVLCNNWRISLHLPFIFGRLLENGLIHYSNTVSIAAFFYICFNCYLFLKPNVAQKSFLAKKILRGLLA